MHVKLVVILLFIVNPNDAEKLPNQNLIGYLRLIQEYCKLIGLENNEKATLHITTTFSY